MSDYNWQEARVTIEDAAKMRRNAEEDGRGGCSPLSGRRHDGRAEETCMISQL